MADAELSDVDLSHNALTDSIPNNFGDMVYLWRLDLSHNSLRGGIPESMSSSTNVRTVRINDNHLDVLPDFTSHWPRIDTLAVQSNKLTFEDIEPYVVAAIDHLVYSPQDSVGRARVVGALLGSSAQLTVSVGGSANEYQWYRNGIPIPGATDTLLAVDPVVEADFGSSYVCEISSTIVTDLTLYSRPVTIRELEFLDAIDFADPAGGILTSPDMLATGGEPMTGAATDGVAKLLLRMEVSECDTMEFAVQDRDRAEGVHVMSEDGSLHSVDGSQSGRQITAFPEQTSDGRWFLFAVFEAPEQFPRSGVGTLGLLDRQEVDRLSLELRLTSQLGSGPSPAPTNGASSVSPVRLSRPPVMLVHGLWSSASTWDSFGAQLNDLLEGIHISAIDYRKSNARRFSANQWRVRTGILKCRDVLRSLGTSCVQVDVVGHSMGGLLSRIWAGAEKYARDGNYDDHRGNYGSGDINRLITLDSPHLGGFTADRLMDFRDDHPVAASILFTVAGVLGKSVRKGAVEDLMTGSHAIIDMNSDSTDVPAHSMVGVVPGITDLSEAHGGLGFLFKILSFMGADTSNPDEGSDLIVTATSQLGGLESPEVTWFEHDHMGATSNPEVVERVFSLLNTRVSSAQFRRGFPVGAIPHPKLISGDAGQPQVMSKSMNAHGDEGEFSIVSPSHGESFRPGAEVTVAVELSAGADLSSVLVVVPDTVAVIDAPPYALSFTVPVRAIGEWPIAAVAKAADGSILPIAEVVIEVVPDAVVESVEIVDPQMLFPTVGLSEQIVVIGAYSDGVDRDISGELKGTQYISADPAIAVVDAEGGVTAVRSGNTEVTVSHGEASSVVEVSVWDIEVFREAGVAHDFVVPLSVGWNLVSLGEPSANQPVATLMAPIVENLTRVIGFETDAINPNPPEIGGKLHNPALAPFINTLEFTDYRLAYWLLMDAADTLVTRGVPSKPLPSLVTSEGDLHPVPDFMGIHGELQVGVEPAAVGTLVEVVDGKGVLAGRFEVHHPGYYGFMPVYRDDAGTAVDEGADQGEWLTVLVDGQPASQRVQWTSFGDEVKLDLAVTGHVPSALPTVFALGHNYPNPFNPSTTISYQLPSEQEVVLSIWNLAGQLVRELVHAPQPAGHRSVTWDGRDTEGNLAANGVYVYEIRAGGFRSARKMLLMK